MFLDYFAALPAVPEHHGGVLHVHLHPRPAAQDREGAGAPARGGDPRGRVAGPVHPEALWPLVFMWAVSHKKQPERRRRAPRQGVDGDLTGRLAALEPAQETGSPEVTISHDTETLPVVESHGRHLRPDLLAGIREVQAGPGHTPTPSSPRFRRGHRFSPSCTSCCPSSIRSATTGGCTPRSCRSSRRCGASSSRCRWRRTSRSRRGMCCSGSTRGHTRSKWIGSALHWPRRTANSLNSPSNWPRPRRPPSRPAQPDRLGIDLRPATPRSTRTGQESGHASEGTGPVAQAQYDRAKESKTKNVISQAEFDRTETYFQTQNGATEYRRKATSSIAAEKLKSGSASLEATRQELARAGSRGAENPHRVQYPDRRAEPGSARDDGACSRRPARTSIRPWSAPRATATSPRSSSVRA